MNIIDKFRSNYETVITSTQGHKVEIAKGTYGVTLDCRVKVLFLHSAKTFYDFIQNSEYYQTDEIKMKNVIKDPKAIIDTVDKGKFDKERVYSIIILGDVIFLMFDKPE
jgi:hypothetical protein